MVLVPDLLLPEKEVAIVYFLQREIFLRLVNALLFEPVSECHPSFDFFSRYFLTLPLYLWILLHEGASSFEHLSKEILCFVRNLTYLDCCPAAIDVGICINRNDISNIFGLKVADAAGKDVILCNRYDIGECLDLRGYFFFLQLPFVSDCVLEGLQVDEFVHI